MKLTIKINEQQSHALRRQGLAAGFMRKKPLAKWTEDETRAACETALVYLMKCITNTDKEGANG